MVKMNRRRIKLVTVLIGSAMLGTLLTGCMQNEGATNKSKESVSEKKEAVNYKYKKSLDKFSKKLDKHMKEKGLPGASVSVTENKKTIYSKQFGYANAEKKIPVKKNSLFYSGSVGKMYGTAAMLKVAQDNNISLDDPVVNHLPGFEMKDERYKKITLRMLLNHSAGLPSDVNAAQMSAGEPMTKDAKVDLLEKLKSQTLRSNPGDFAVYSNIGFELAQLVIEKYSGQSFSSYLKQEFIEPLNLKNTHMVSEENKNVDADRFALPVSADGKTLPREYSATSMEATGGVVASTEDTCKFIDGILSAESNILNEESIEELKKDQSLTAKFPEKQGLNGLGWDEKSRTITETPVYDKSGASTHFSTKVITAPEAGITISSSVTDFHNQFLYEELKNLMHDILVEKGVIKENNNEPDYPKEIDNSDDDNNDLNGSYTGGEDLHDLNGLWKIEAKKNKLKNYTWNGVEWEDSEDYTLREDGSYGRYDKDTKTFTSYSFEKNDNGTYLMKRILTPEYDKTTAIGKKIPNRESSEAWEKYNNKLWLRTSVIPMDYQASSCYCYLQTMKDFPGYVSMNGGASPMEVKSDTKLSSIENLPSGSGYSDLNMSGNSFSWIGMDFINAEDVDELSDKDTSISFDKPNTMKWYYVPKDMKIDIDQPFNKVRVFSINPEMELSYDSLEGTKPFEAKEGSYVGISSSETGKVDVGISADK